MSPVRLARRAMGTTFEVALAAGDETVAEEALALVDRLEDQLSIFLSNSEVSAINAAPGPVPVEPALFDLLVRMRTIHRRTGGAFDGGIAHAVLDRRAGTVQADALDLGGIGKGYALDRVVALLRERGVREAFVHGGTSTVYAMGTWTVGLIDPRDPDTRFGTLALRDQALSTSSNLGGKPGHIPRGRHVAAWALCDHATDADAYSTAFLIRGLQRIDGVGGMLLEEGVRGPLCEGMRPRIFGSGVSRRRFMRGTAAALSLSMLPRPAAAQEPQRELRVAVVGTGEQGRLLLTRLARMPGVKVPAVCDTSAAAREKAVRIAGRDVETYESAAHLLDEERIDAVVVATPTHAHRAPCEQALAAGVHVFCEAPLAHRTEDAKAIARAAQKSGLVFQTGHQRRCSELYPHVLTHVKSGAIGDLLAIRAQWNRKLSWRRPDKAANWRLSSETSGGLLLEQGSHVFDLAHWFFGALPETVMGMGSLLKWRDGRDVDDTVQVMLRYPGGRQLHFGASLVNSLGDEHEVLVGGSAGVLLQRQAKGLLFKEADTALVGWEEYAKKEMRDNRRGIILDAQATKYKDGEAKQIGPDAGKADYHAELLRFLEAVRAGKPPKCGAVAGMQAAVVGIVAAEAVRKGEPVRFRKEHFAL
jgi:predicted dehydrogenase